MWENLLFAVVDTYAEALFCLESIE